MKILSGMACIIAIIFAFIPYAFAEDIDNELTPSGARYSLAKKAVGGVVGIFAGIFAHELNHQIVAKAENVDITWNQERWTAYTDDKRKLRNIALGGFAAQIISSEILLDIDKIPKDNSFVVGWLSFNIANAIVYTLENELRPGGYGDLQTIDQSGLNSRWVEAAIVGHALLSAYRLWEKPAFPMFIKATRQEIVVGLSWRW